MSRTSWKDNSTDVRFIGNYPESWRAVCQQAIDKTGFAVTIGLSTYGNGFVLYTTDSRDHGPFGKRVRELARDAGLIK